MGTRGPVPKRSDQRVRRNADDPVETIAPAQAGDVSQPRLGLDDPHKIVLDFWRSLGQSAQSQFYEPSDWQYARVMLHLLDGVLKAGRPSSQMVSAVDSMMSNLLVSEGDRRRARIEVDRGGEGDAGALPDNVADFYLKQMQAG